MLDLLLFSHDLVQIDFNYGTNELKYGIIVPAQSFIAEVAPL